MALQGVIQGGKFGTLKQQQAATGDKMLGAGDTGVVTYKNSKPVIPKTSDTASSTVVSDTNIRDNVIPGIQAKAGQMLGTDQNPLYLKPGETPDAYKARVAAYQAPQGTTGTDSTQSTTQSDTGLGSEYDDLYKSVLGQTPAQDNFYDSDLALLQSMQKTSDTKTANQLAGIQSQFQQQRNDLQASQAAGVQGANALLNRTGGGRTGSGSMLVSAVSRGYIRAASNIDLQEQQATNEALSAQADNNYKLLGEKLDVLKDKRQEKLDVVNKLYDNMVAEKQQTQKDIESTLSNAAQNGAPQSVLDAVSQAGTSAEAIQAASQYLTDPTTPGGQYATYVRQAQAAGQTPISAGDFLAKQQYKMSYASASASEAAKAAYATTSTGTSDLTALPPQAQESLKSNGFTAFNSGTQDLAIQLVNGQIAPAELSKRTTGTSSYNDVLTAANKYSQATSGKAFDIAQADRDYKFATNTATQNTLNYLGSLVGSDNGSGLAGGNLDELISLSDARASTTAGIAGIPDVGSAGQSLGGGLPPLNDVSQWAKIQTGDPEMAAYYGTLLEVSDQVAKVLQGGGTGSGTSDAKLAQAQALFQKGFTPAQVSAVSGALKALLASRAANMVKDNPYLSDYATQFGVQTKNGVTTTNQKIIQDEQTATGKISAFYNLSPENADIVDAMHQQFPDLSASEVVQNLGL